MPLIREQRVIISLNRVLLNIPDEWAIYIFLERYTIGDFGLVGCKNFILDTLLEIAGEFFSALFSPEEKNSNINFIFMKKQFFH